MGVKRGNSIASAAPFSSRSTNSFPSFIAVCARGGRLDVVTQAADYFVHTKNVGQMKHFTQFSPNLYLISDANNANAYIIWSKPTT